jgi:hypothetical protein
MNTFARNLAIAAATGLLLAALVYALGVYAAYGELR